MAQQMLRLAHTAEPDTAHAHPDWQDDLWQDRVQQWRNGFMKNARERQGDREPGGMDVRSPWVPQCYSLTPVKEGHRRILDALLDEWNVSASWDHAARDELVKEWHKLPGTPRPH